jgi:hypothetical protein
MGSRRGRRIVGAIFVSWWLILIIGFGLLGNGYLVILALRAHAYWPAVGLAICFAGTCVYVHRTIKFRDELKDLIR